MENSLFPKIFVNSPNQQFQILNHNLNIKSDNNPRQYFKCVDANFSQEVQSTKLNDQSLFLNQISTGCFCPQGYYIYMIHVGYTPISHVTVQNPETPYVDYVNRQVLKLSRPFILGIVVQDLKDKSLKYIQMKQYNKSLYQCITEDQNDPGFITKKHSFNAQIWDSQGNIISQGKGGNFLKAPFHTLMRAVPNKYLQLSSSQQVQLDVFQFNTPPFYNGEQLIGIIYINPTDIVPTCIYGFPYDIMLFQNPIKSIQQDIFNISQQIAKITKTTSQFLDQLINQIVEVFIKPNLDNLYLNIINFGDIKKQLKLIIQGSTLVFNSTLYGKIDSTVTQICTQSQYSYEPLCSCILSKSGDKCSINNNNCRINGYKTSAILEQPCTQFQGNIVVNEYDQKNIIQIEGYQDINVGNIST